MRRFFAVFAATVTGLIVLLSFKTASVKAPPAAAFAPATLGTPSDPTGSAPASSAAVSSAPASSVPESTVPATSAAATTSAAVAQPTVTQSGAPTTAATKPTPKPTAKPTPKPSATVAAKKTVTGSAITVGEGRRVFGVVQVQLTIQNGKVISAVAIRYPNNESRSTEISNYSIPVLSRELLAAQGSSINAVSGATYTSQAYAQSAQAAIDAAKV